MRPRADPSVMEISRESTAAAIVGTGTVQIQRRFNRPRSRSLHSHHIQNLLHQRRCRSPADRENRSPWRNLDQKAFQFPAIPFRENILKLLVIQSADIFQQVVRLRDQLHVAVFDAVVHHLHKMPRPALRRSTPRKRRRCRRFWRLSS
jgi:hypothetical protein